MVDAFFLEVLREWTTKYLGHEVRQGENWRKGCIFTVLWEMKQPHTMTGPSFSGCVLEYGCFISTVWWKERLFLSFFRWLALWLEAFIGYSVGILRNKASIISYSRVLFFRLCPRKWLMPFFLKFQGNNRQNASAIKSAKGKNWRKGCIFTMLWRWNNHVYGRALFYCLTGW